MGLEENMPMSTLAAASPDDDLTLSIEEVAKVLEVSPAAAPIHELLTVDELAVLLRVDRKTVYEAISRQEIPGVRRIGKKTIRISRAAVLDWIEGRATPSAGQGRVLSRRNP